MEKKAFSIQERITKNIEKWYLLEPLYFLVWTTHELVVNPRIKTIRTGNGLIEYNPDFINTLSDDLLNAVLKAEITRILLKHPYSRKKENAEASYLASNITLKEYTETPLNFPTAQQMFGTKDFDRKHFEFYYNKILEQAQPKRIFRICPKCKGLLVLGDEYSIITRVSFEGESPKWTFLAVSATKFVQKLSEIDKFKKP